MEHTIQGYLSRQSTQLLLLLLQDCTSKDKLQDYTYIIPTILEILSARSIPIPREIQDRLDESQSSNPTG